MGTLEEWMTLLVKMKVLIGQQKNILQEPRGEAYRE